MLQENNLDIGGRLIWTMALPNDIPENELPPFLVTEAGMFYALEQFYSRRSGKDGYLVIYTRSGKGLLTYRGEQFELLADSAVLIDCHQFHEYRTLPGETNNWTFYWLHFESDNMGFFSRSIYPEAFSVLEVGKTLIDVFNVIIENLQYNGQDTLFLINDSVYKILTQMVGAAATIRTPGEKEAVNKEIIRKAAEYIKTYHWQTLDIEEVAQNFNLSKFYFIRLFKEIIGVTPYSYMIMERINISKKLLHTTDLRISEISLIVGFADEGNFIRTFKSIVGRTPKSYRVYG